MIPVVRDFPKGCGPRGRFATQCSQHLVQSKSPNSSSLYDSESEDPVVPLFDKALSVSSAEVEEKDGSQALDTTDPIDLLETSDEAIELPEEVVTEVKPTGNAPRRRILAIRDYPIPPGRFQTPICEDLVQSKVLDSSPKYDSEFEDLMVSFPANGLESMKSADEGTQKALDDIEQIDLEETSEYEAKELSEEAQLEFNSSRYDLESEDSIISMYNISLESLGFSEQEGIDMPKVIDSMGLSDQSETSEYKATDLTEETVSNFMHPILPPNTKDSTTDFPKGIRRRGPQLREEDILEATNLETKGLNHELSDAEDPLLEVLSDSESFSTNSCKSNLQKSENLSGQCSNQFPENGPSTTANRGPKQIVIALMAAPNCPWSQKKRASRSNTTRETNKRKKKKH